MRPNPQAQVVAAGISMPIGGLASLKAVLAIMTGIAVAVPDTTAPTLARVRDPRITGLSPGAASSGTARAIQVSEIAGAFAGLAMALGGLMAAVLVPHGVMAP